MIIPEELFKQIKSRKVILFAGAGLPMNLGLPSWGGLIAEMSKDLGYESEIFNLFGDFLELAEFYKLERGNIGSLRSWMDVNWHSPEIKIENSSIYKLVVDLDFPIIYTTNYDRWLERAFDHYEKKYTKIAQVEDIVRIEERVTQIIKLHGDLHNDNSIVLTESSYFERLNFESSLDIKLRSDILGKTILFIGYSLNDINIRYLIYKLNKLWEGSKETSVRPQSYMFLTKPNPVKEKILKSRSIIPIVSDIDDPNKGLEVFLEELLSGRKG